MRSKKENVTDETIERKPQVLQQVKRKHQQPPTQKHMKGLTADVQWGRRSDANDAKRRRGKDEELVEKTMGSA